VRTEIQTGVTDGDWIEVTNLQLPPKPDSVEARAAITGSEQVILGDLSTLADGGPVEVAAATADKKVADASRPPVPTPAGVSPASGLAAGVIDESTGPVRPAATRRISQP
jgi:hypothetical protein